jgi:hypothetical protein
MDLDAPQGAEAPEESAEPAELDAAPLVGGIASLAWNRSEFDDELLSRIAPLAKDLRAWLNRVETRAAG